MELKTQDTIYVASHYGTSSLILSYGAATTVRSLLSPTSYGSRNSFNGANTSLWFRQTGGGAHPRCLRDTSTELFLPAFSMRYHRRFPYVHPLLTGRSARVLYTQNSPWLAGWIFRRDLFWQWISGAVFKHCGFRPVRRLALYSAKDASDETRLRFLASARRLGLKAQ